MISKTPTQVASHAQKYFIRQQLSSNSNSKDGRRRPSIHDITIRNLADSSLPSSKNNPADSITDSLNDPSSTLPFPEQKPGFGPTEPASSLWEAAPSGIRLQDKDLPLAAFGRFGVKSQRNPAFGLQSTRYRICG